MSAKEEIYTVCNNLHIYFEDPKIREALQHICSAITQTINDTEQIKKELEAVKMLLHKRI